MDVDILRDPPEGTDCATPFAAWWVQSRVNGSQEERLLLVRAEAKHVREGGHGIPDTASRQNLDPHRGPKQ